MITTEQRADWIRTKQTMLKYWPHAEWNEERGKVLEREFAHLSQEILRDACGEVWLENSRAKQPDTKKIAHAYYRLRDERFPLPPRHNFTLTEQDEQQVEQDREAARAGLSKLGVHELHGAYTGYMKKLRREVTEIPPLTDWKANICLAVWNHWQER